MLWIPRPRPRPTRTWTTGWNRCYSINCSTMTFYRNRRRFQWVTTLAIRATKDPSKKKKESSSRWTIIVRFLSMKSFLLIITPNNSNSTFNVKMIWWISSTNVRPNSNFHQRPRLLFASFTNRKWNPPNYQRPYSSVATNFSSIPLLQRTPRPMVKPSDILTQVKLFRSSSYTAVYLRFSILFSATTSSPVPSGSMQPSGPIVPARVLKGKKFKRGGRMTSRAYVLSLIVGKSSFLHGILSFRI